MTEHLSIIPILTQTKINVSPKEVTFDTLHGTDAKIIENLKTLLKLFTLPDDMEDADDMYDAELIEIDDDEILPGSMIIRDNVKKHMDEHPDEYISAMEEIWMNMKYRAESWKAVDKKSNEYLDYINKIPNALMYNSETSIIKHCIHIVDEAYYKINGGPDHENLTIMARFYEFEAGLFVILCMMIINPEYITQYYKNVKDNIMRYFIYTGFLQGEGNGICAVLSLRYVCGILRCNLMDDEEYLKAFRENIPKGLEKDLHEEIIDEVDLLYAYTVLMKYKLYPDLDIEEVMLTILDAYTCSVMGATSMNTKPIMSKKEFIETENRKSAPMRDTVIKLLNDKFSDFERSKAPLDQRVEYDYYRNLLTDLLSTGYVYTSFPKKFTERESIVDVVKSTRESVSRVFKDDSNYKNLYAVVFRRYIVGNRVKDTDNRLEFLLYLSYFHSILTLDKRKDLHSNSHAYDKLCEISRYLNPVWFNINAADSIKEEILACPNIISRPPNTNILMLVMFLSDIIACKLDYIPASLFDRFNNNIKNNKSISPEDMYEYFMQNTPNDIFPDTREITGISDMERMYFNAAVFATSINIHQGMAIYVSLLKLQHETNELLKTADVSKSSIPVRCSMNRLIKPNKKSSEVCRHAYVKELTNEGIIVYDPNLSFSTCSDMSITDIYLPTASGKMYSFITERIRFLGGDDENKPLEIIAWIFGITIVMIAIIGLIIYFVNKDSNETFCNKGF